MLAFETADEDPDLLDWESPPDPPVDVVLHSLEHLEKTIPDPVARQVAKFGTATLGAEPTCGRCFNGFLP